MSIWPRFTSTENASAFKLPPFHANSLREKTTVLSRRVQGVEKTVTNQRNFVYCLIIYALTDLNSSKSSRRWASSNKIAFSPKEPVIDETEESFEVVTIFCIS